jgi:hypothetical protein
MERLRKQGVQAQGYLVESGKTRAAKIFRPVLFGENGVPEVSYEIDAFHDGLGIAVEVEAGRGASNNADYRDIVTKSLILDAEYLALLMPVTYRSTSSIPAFSRTATNLRPSMRPTASSCRSRARACSSSATYQPGPRPRSGADRVAGGRDARPPDSASRPMPNPRRPSHIRRWGAWDCRSRPAL